MSRSQKDPDMDTYSGRVAARIRNLREEAGLTVEEVVTKMEKHGYQTTVQTFYKWENGMRKIHLDAIPAFAKTIKLKNYQEVFPKK